jgi:hypothetical protein
LNPPLSLGKILRFERAMMLAKSWFS